MKTEAYFYTTRILADEISTATFKKKCTCIFYQRLTIRVCKHECLFFCVSQCKGLFLLCFHSTPNPIQILTIALFIPRIETFTTIRRDIFLFDDFAFIMLNCKEKPKRLHRCAMSPKQYKHCCLSRQPSFHLPNRGASFHCFKWPKKKFLKTIKLAVLVTYSLSCILAALCTL